MLKKWQVLISKSHDIYTNLAWEDWLYRKMDFTHVNLLLLWRNNPCVVIGRYQNPWKEVNVSILEDTDIRLARRHSGGGTVYHDLGNVNFTFLTERKLYNRRTNLEFIVKVLRDKYEIPAVVSPRDDIVVKDKLKISGTAAKLGRTTAYHHCTLLCNVKKDKLRAVLTPTNKGIQTNASESVPSPTVNLTEIHPSITSSDLITHFASAFNRLNSTPSDSTITEIDPSEHEYPGLDAAAADLATHHFLYGNTPKFNIIREFHLPATSVLSSSIMARFDFLVEKGKIASFESGFTVDGSPDNSLAAAADTIASAVVGRDFGTQDMWDAFARGTATSAGGRNVMDEDSHRFICNCIFQSLSFA